jgi:hypothetical protein
VSYADLNSLLSSGYNKKVSCKTGEIEAWAAGTFALALNHTFLVPTKSIMAITGRDVLNVTSTSIGLVPDVLVVIAS